MTALNLIVKIALFAVFLALLYLVLDYFVGIIQTNLNIPFIDLFSYLGVLQAIQVLISISVASYVANQVIAYFRSA
ncbi:putative membrane protein [Arcobacter venerupis]|uniref:Membrane protein n=1 Tax=Arcobacter venerupis TaxID=1054033 RepID=A0AAE7BB81_9BACT|nr:hypothetical protein [Arcobacter venerupis]QKF67040.1 putative membrane protein [Arcobacter venerupis]RWS50014.1 hypothetical protein CKA56_05915 [Arcobacter venerupis]